MPDERRFYETPATGPRCSAPAALRNREPIAKVLADWLPATGLVLEVASGTGEHAVYFAERFPALEWQPSDIHPDALASIADWPIGRADAVLSINMLHISPWASAIGLVAGAERLLAAGAPLILYGPWLKDDIETAPSNWDFDADLKRRDPAWGLRSVEEFAAEAEPRGFALRAVRPMPANNLMMLWRKT
jgi:hypothetical protein